MVELRPACKIWHEKFSEILYTDVMRSSESISKFLERSKGREEKNEIV